MTSERRYCRSLLEGMLVLFIPKAAEALYLAQAPAYYARCALTAAALAVLYACLVSWPRLARLRPPLLACGLLPGLFELGHLLIYRQKITPMVFVALFETYPEESRQFLSGNVTAATALGLAAYGLCCWALPAAAAGAAARLSWKGRPALGLRAAALAAAAASLLGLSRNAWVPYSIFDLPSEFRVYRNERKKLLRFFDTFKNAPQALPEVTPIDGQTVVLVLGEANNRRDMSLYGYARPTNPRLSRRLGEMLRFENVVSPHSQTVPTLSKVLTLRNYDNERSLAQNMNVVQLAKLAGYRTCWLSNQPGLGLFETLAGAISKYADQALWLNDGLHWDGVHHYDEAVLKPFTALLRQKGPQFIVVHLMGAHETYQSRYPPSFRTFKGEPPSRSGLSESERRVVNAYDNAILYNDYIVDALISELAAAPTKNAALIYLSDHGEEVYDQFKFAGHAEVILSNAMFEIPFLIWTSPEHLRRKPWFENGRRNLRKIYSSENLIHTLHDILGIKTSFYEPSRSLLSADFKERKVKVGGRDYDPKRSPALLYTRTANDIAFGGKLLVHRVDSLERYRKLIDRGYRGFEVDLVYERLEDRLDVRHPPTPSIGLSFDRYLEEKASRDFYFWLDVKNLTDANAAGFLRRLDALDRKHKLKRRIVVESSRPSALGKIAAGGYHTSLWLPFIHKNPSEWHKIHFSAVSAKLMNRPFSAISEHVSIFPLMEKFFPDCDKLVWGVDERKDAALLSRLEANKRVKVILVDVETEGMR